MSKEELEEAKWLVIKSMLDESPTLMERARKYLLGEKDWEKVFESRT